MLAVIFSVRTATRSAKGRVRTLQIPEPTAINLEKACLAKPWNVGSFLTLPTVVLKECFSFKGQVFGRPNRIPIPSINQSTNQDFLTTTFFAALEAQLCDSGAIVSEPPFEQQRNKNARKPATVEPLLECDGCEGRCPTLVRGLLGTGPPGPTLESASLSPPQGSIWYRKRVESGNRCRIGVELMPNKKCQIDP